MDTEKQKKKVLHFRKGDEHRVVIEKENYTDSIFSEQYKQSLLIWNRVCNDYKDTGDVKSADENVYNVDGVSNIIAFCGDRGEGKTSCQMSFAELLHNEKERNEFLKQSKIDITLACTKPFVMPLVDPLYFDSNHHLLDHVIGQLYSVIEETDRNKEFLSKLKNNFAERKELLMQFQSVRRCLKQIENTCDDSYDELEELSNRAASVRLHTEISLLFKRFLKYVGEEKLVIPIDDIDLNMSWGYPMVEDIRKYLCNPYCVLLLAVKVDQLITVIQTRMMIDLQMIGESENRALSMAQKYVTKLLPYENRVIMPTIADWADWKIQCQFEENEEEQELLVKDYVVQLIFDRTRYLFYNEKGQVSPIVPRSLRGLRQLLGMLESMTPYVTDEGPEQNKATFKDYFYHEWVSCLTKDDQLFAQQLVSHTDIISLNKFVVSHIAQKLSNDEKDDLSKDIMRSANMAHNISVGDVFYVLGRFAHSISTEDQKNLVCFIYSFYSITLYDLYDEITIDEEHLHPNLFNRESSKKDDKKDDKEDKSGANVYRSDAWYRHTNRLQQFVNGSMFTFNLGDLLPKEDSKLARDRRVLFLEDWENDLKLVRNHIAHNKDFTEETKDAFLRCELLAMFTTRWVSGNNKFVLALDRREIDPYYLTDYTKHTNYLEFNILAPYTNAINIRYAYHRFEQLISGFYEQALQNDWSLLRKMMNAADLAKNGKETKENAPAQGATQNPTQYLKLTPVWEMMLASNSVIRVSEVQISLMEQLKNRREANNESKTKDILHNVCTTIEHSGIKLYHRGAEARQSYEIHFDFLSVLYKYMTESKEFISRFERGMKLYDGDGHQKDKKAAEKSKSRNVAMELTDNQLIIRIKQKFKIKGHPQKSISSDEVKPLLQSNNPTLYDAFGEDFWDKVFAENVKARSYNPILQPMLTVDKKKVMSLILV